jgi:predicted O-methyltransferase YrrM
LRVAFRGEIAAGYGATLFRRPIAWMRFVGFDRETTNFTYDLRNEQELVAWVAEAVRRPVNEIEAYLREVRSDREFREELSQRLRPCRHLNDVPRFGRRLGWYCVVRATKPRLLVETGTADGLGTALLAKAMQRNTDDGHAGRFLSFDIGAESGWLVPDGVGEFVELVTGDSAETLPRELEGQEVDVFIHDSDHSAAHERLELQIALAHAADRLVLMSDNAHVTDELRDLAQERGAEFRFFREEPRRHFYPGAGIGLAIFD